MADAFDNGLGDPNLTTILIGPRGCGKTALLTCIADEAQRHGWVSVRTAAAPGMLDDIVQRSFEAPARIVSPRSRKHLTGISVAQLVELEWAVDPASEANWRTRMNALFAELGTAVEAIGRYAYLMQLVGHCAWTYSGESPEITASHAADGVVQAGMEFRDGVLRSTYREMSKGDRAFAAAMLPERDGSRLADVARRMGKATNYAATYKARLLALGAIGESDEGVLDFAIPMLREYLAERLSA
ncbi:MAG: hypothetical protein IJ087_14910 [Eggerthellaceae bacterium]|nr:hypothetical protein [Eggerthellaceae bacterium]